MINVKNQVYRALRGVCRNVTDMYPKKDAEFPAILYVEEQNAVQGWTDNREYVSKLRYRIEIYDRQSTSELAVSVDQAVSALGLRRCDCQDVQMEGIRCKLMRYEGLVDNTSEQVYQENY